MYIPTYYVYGCSLHLLNQCLFHSRCAYLVTAVCILILLFINFL